MDLMRLFYLEFKIPEVSEKLSPVKDFESFEEEW